MPSTRSIFPSSRLRQHSHPYSTYLQQGHINPSHCLPPLPSSTDVGQSHSLSTSEVDSPGTSASFLPQTLPSEIPHAHNPPDDKQSNKVARPPNAFIIFRSEFGNTFPLSVGSGGSRISRIASYVWNSMNDVEKEPYQIKAQIAKDEHSRKHPGYNYRPKHNKGGVAGRKSVEAIKDRKIGELVLDGVQGEELKVKVKDLESVKLTARTEKVIKTVKSKATSNPIIDPSSQLPSSSVTPSNPMSGMGILWPNAPATPASEDLLGHSPSHLPNSSSLNPPSWQEATTRGQTTYPYPQPLAQVLASPTPPSIHAPSLRATDISLPTGHQIFPANNPLPYDTYLWNPSSTHLTNTTSFNIPPQVHGLPHTPWSTHSNQSEFLGILNAPSVKTTPLTSALEPSIPASSSPIDFNAILSDFPMDILAAMSSPEAQFGAVGSQVNNVESLSTMPSPNSQEIDIQNWIEELFNPSTIP